MAMAIPGTQSCNTQLDGSLLCGTDCDDDRPTVNTRALEACDGVDNNCNGTVDEGVQGTFFADHDGDGFGAGPAIHACFAPNNTALRNSDCDDNNPLTHPGQFEIRDGVDNNCNGHVDEKPLIALQP